MSQSRFLKPLREIQDRLGSLPRKEIEALSERLAVPLHRLHEVISFLPHFRLEPPGAEVSVGPEVEVQVCRDMVCHLRGAEACLRRLEDIAKEFGVAVRVTVQGVCCLGRCDGAPAALIQLHRIGPPDQSRVLQRPAVLDYAARLRTIVAAHLEGQDVPPDVVDRSPRPWRIDPYQSPAAKPPAGHRGQWPVQPSHLVEQRRDLRLGLGDRAPRRGVVSRQRRRGHALVSRPTIPRSVGPTAGACGSSRSAGMSSSRACTRSASAS